MPKVTPKQEHLISESELKERENIQTKNNGVEKVDCLFKNIFINKNNIITIERGKNRKVTLDYGFQSYEYNAFTLILNGNQTLYFISLNKREESLKILTNLIK